MFNEYEYVFLLLLNHQVIFLEVCYNLHGVTELPGNGTLAEDGWRLQLKARATFLKV